MPHSANVRRSAPRHMLGFNGFTADAPLSRCVQVRAACQLSAALRALHCGAAGVVADEKESDGKELQWLMRYSTLPDDVRKVS